MALGRDLVNAPANELGPQELEQEALKLAEAFRRERQHVPGRRTGRRQFPARPCGRARRRPPRIVDLGWGREAPPQVTLVGKGVGFDSGGLDIKPETGMGLMKKDMGGAASALRWRG